MTFRLPFQISRVGALCRPANPHGLVSKLALKKGNLKKQILYQIKTNPFANILQECKPRTSYVPIRYYTTKTKFNFDMKTNPHKPEKTARLELVMADYKRKKVYKKINEINLGPNFDQGPLLQAQPEIKFSTKYNTNSSKHDYYGMESYFSEIKDIDDQINIEEHPSINPQKPNIQNILTDTDLKTQNDIWKQGGSEIVNNLNSKNSIWKYIYGKRKTLKHHLWQDLTASKMWGKLFQSPTSTKAQQKSFYKAKKYENRTKREVNAEEGNYEVNTKISTFAEPIGISDDLEVKNLITDCKYKISNIPQNLNASEIFEQQRNKIKPNTFLEEDRRNFTKPNVVMATVYNRQGSSHNNNSCFHEMNETNDPENYFDFKYPENCYNAENYDNYSLVAEGFISSKNTHETDQILNLVKMATSQKGYPSLKTTVEEIMNQCSSKSINQEKINNEMKNEKQEFMKIEPSLLKQKQGTDKNKTKSTRVPKTLGEIYGVGKIPFLIEVSEPGQSKFTKYFVVIETPMNKVLESTENNTNSPLSLIFDNILNKELLEETSPPPPLNSSKFCKTEAIPEQTVITKPHVPHVCNTIGKAKNKISPLLEINDDNKEFKPQYPQMKTIQPNIIERENTRACLQNRFKEEKLSKRMDNPFIRYKKKHHEMQKIMNTTKHMINQGKLKSPVICKQVRQYSTLNSKNQTIKIFNYKLHPKVRHTNRTLELQQKRKLSTSLACPYCGRYPCVCCSPCTSGGWCPSSPYRPQCCPKFQLDYCYPRYRWNCEIPIPPCQKIEAPYPSFGECLPTWCKEPTECFDFDQHNLQPKNQVSPKINLMEESIPKVTVVDPSLERKCLRDKCCEPCYPPIDQRICCDCPYKVPVDGCCPPGRPHCYCWPEKPCMRNPPPYRCFSDEELEFPDPEVTECDLASKFAIDLYRRMGKKCNLPFSPACSTSCDLRSGEPVPVNKYDPKAQCATTCIPPGTYLAPCTPNRTPPCQSPGCDTCINCCMPTEGIKKTRCHKRCYPQDNFGNYIQGPPACCPPECCPATDCKPKECPNQTPQCPSDNKTK